MYIGSVLLLVYWTGGLALRRQRNPDAEATRADVIYPLWIAAMASYVLCGASAWVTDFLLCKHMSALGPLAVMFLHPLWHVGAGTGTWLAIQVLAGARAQMLGSTPS